MDRNEIESAPDHRGELAPRPPSPSPFSKTEA